MIEITESAAKRICFLANGGNKLRVSVEGGGCSGFQYKYEFFTGDSNPDDIILEKDGAIVVIDSISMEFLKGSKLNFVEELGASYFEIKNPNASSGCGCGNSFSI